jgi:hypothetical protein
MAQFTRYIGIDYSGAETPDSSRTGLRVYVAEGWGYTNSGTLRRQKMAGLESGDPRVHEIEERFSLRLRKPSSNSCGFCDRGGVRCPPPRARLLSRSPRVLLVWAHLG